MVWLLGCKFIVVMVSVGLMLKLLVRLMVDFRILLNFMIILVGWGVKVCNSCGVFVLIGVFCMLLGLLGVLLMVVLFVC